MAGVKRKLFSGVGHIVRFNWHFYVIAVALILCFIAGSAFAAIPLAYYFAFAAGIIVATTLVSLSVSFYVYDLSELYKLTWLNVISIAPDDRLANIHSGFDETSILIAKRYPASPLCVLDFYDPAKHTEISIKRARRAYPAYPGTIKISTTQLDLQRASLDYIFLILAAHEIRDDEERVAFFALLHEALSENGKIIVIEHLRDMPNFFAYNIGFFHFLSENRWLATFKSARLRVEKQFRITPFIKAFILKKHGH